MKSAFRMIDHVKVVEEIGRFVLAGPQLQLRVVRDQIENLIWQGADKVYVVENAKLANFQE